MSAHTPTHPGPLARPTLLPGLRRLWRSRHHLQLGLDPARAVVIELTDPRTAAVLDLLDGTRSHRDVIAHAARHGVRDEDARTLIDSLRHAGLVVGAQTLLPHNLPDDQRQRLADEAAALALRGTDTPATPAQILRRRAQAKIAVAGHGTLAGPIAVALAQAGVGHVAPAADLPRSHENGTHDGDLPERAAPSTLSALIAQRAPGTRTDRLRLNEATFVVQTAPTGPATLTAASYARRRLAHLTVGIRDGAAIVGPLVPATGAPCLNCLDLHRQDRDPDWPTLAAQLQTAPPAEPCATATLLTAAGIAAGEVLGWVDGGTPHTLGTSVEVTVGGQFHRRRWQPHPRCHCVRRTHRHSRPAK